MQALDVLGWISSGLVVWSLTVSRVWRFRWLNLAGSSLATAVNALLGIWPFAAMNLVIAVIDGYWIVRLSRERHDRTVYQVLEVAPTDTYFRHLLAVTADDLRLTHPRLVLPLASPEESARSVFLVLRGDETVGLVIVRDAGGAVGEVEVDYVTRRFRDFTPGEFVYEKSGIFAEKGFDRLRLVEDVAAEEHYYRRVGFDLVDGVWERPVVPAAA